MYQRKDALVEFAQAVVSGSARVIASVGDEQNALLMLTVEADFAAGAGDAAGGSPLPAGRG